MTQCGVQEKRGAESQHEERHGARGMAKRKGETYLEVMTQRGEEVRQNTGQSGSFDTVWGAHTVWGRVTARREACCRIECTSQR